MSIEVKTLKFFHAEDRSTKQTWEACSKHKSRQTLVSCQYLGRFPTKFHPHLSVFTFNVPNIGNQQLKGTWQTKWRSMQWYIIPLRTDPRLWAAPAFTFNYSHNHTFSTKTRTWPRTKDNQDRSTALKHTARPTRVCFSTGGNVWHNSFTNVRSSGSLCRLWLFKGSLNLFQSRYENCFLFSKEMKQK